MKRRMSIVLATVSAVALLVSTPAQAVASGLTIAQAADLQKRVDEVLAHFPGGKQVSATEITYDGLDVTVDPLFSEKQAPAISAIDCSGGYFCIHVRGTKFAFKTCQMWTLSNWWGLAPYHNNQTVNTVARAYAQNGSTVVFSHTAKGDGQVDVGPWWYFRPC